ncbi:hypothetical protein CHUAL_009499 [Chamberlinius hualienensis]
MLPETFQKALRTAEAKHWKEAIDTELKMMKQRGIWTIEKLPSGQHLLSNRWVFAFAHLEVVPPVCYKEICYHLPAISNLSAWRSGRRKGKFGGDLEIAFSLQLDPLPGVAAGLQ